MKHFQVAVTLHAACRNPVILHPPDVVSLLMFSSSFVFVSVFFFHLPVTPSVVIVIVSSKNSTPIEETSLGYVSRFAMISLFFASGYLYLSDLADTSVKCQHDCITDYL